MPRGIGRIGAADELLVHQIANTFDVAEQSDQGWTEKIWASVGRKDGSLQVDFGIGKYANRNVIDGFAGAARDTAQWTVRASRELSCAPDTVGVGPLRYEVVEPLRKVRLVLEPNDVQPVAFDLVYEATLPAFFEDRDLGIDEQGRVVMDTVRFHQAGTATGTLTVDGIEHAVEPDDWFAFRDRSWGVRQYVGVAATDLPPVWRENFMSNLQMHWSPLVLRRADGSTYEFHYYFRDSGPNRTHYSSHINESDGTQIRVAEVRSAVKYAQHNRGIVGGDITAVLDDGDRTERTFTIKPLSNTGFRLNPALYFGWKGMFHGSWKGRDHRDGEFIADCEREIDATATPTWQLRDRLVSVTEGTGSQAAVGYGVVESMLIGDWPDLVIKSGDDAAAIAGSGV
jgi:hypothetical protein